MANWKDIAIDNFRSAVTLFDAKRYRSAVSRFYYAAFIATTYELIQRGATPQFRDGRPTPAHTQIRDSQFLDLHFAQFTEERRINFRKTIAELYRDRIAADYSDLRVDREAAKDAHRRAENVFRYLGINHER